MKWVSAILASIVDLNLRSLSWLWWMKLLDIMWNWSLLPMTFSINLPSVFNRTIGLKDLGILYNTLLGFRIMIVVEVLKWVDQYPTSIHMFAILIIFLKHNLSLKMHLRYLYDSLSGPGANELLHLTIVLVNSSSENCFQDNVVNDPISFKIFSSM